MNNLECGGAEKALVSLLNEMDYERYEVDLLLFSQKGMFLKQLPSNVRLLPAPSAFQFFDTPIKQVFLHAVKRFDFSILWARFQMKKILQSEKVPAVKEQRIWPILRSVLPKNKGSYDAVIAYLQKTPIYYAVDKVDAKVKIGFIHNDYTHLQLNATIDRPYFDQLDVIASISESCVAILKDVFPEFAQKIKLKYNIVSKAMIQRLADEEVPEEFSGNTIVSVGRLNYQKAFDEAIVSSALLKQKGIAHRWYVLGEGSDRPELERKIKEYGVTEEFILLGLRENPYPYIKKATVYAQPSRFEGKSIAIDEAKVLLKPIVVTNFPSAKDQIIDGVTGIIADLNPEAVASQLERLLMNPDLRSQLSENLKSENVVGKEELVNLYHWIDKENL